MALILSLRQGQDFYVEDTRFEVTKITKGEEFHLRCDQDGEVTTYAITDRRSVEILPDVYVSSGSPDQANMAAVVIKAPREILILRGDLWRESVNEEEEDGDQPA